MYSDYGAGYPYYNCIPYSDDSLSVNDILIDQLITKEEEQDKNAILWKEEFLPYHIHPPYASYSGLLSSVLFLIKIYFGQDLATA